MNANRDTGREPTGHPLHPAPAESPTECLRLTRLHKTFGTCRALRGVDLTAETGQLVALLGPSGCGKTTLLRLVAGFEWPDAGSIRIKGRIVADDKVRIAPEDRRVGMVFQDYALFPHVNVNGNIAFGLRGSARDKAARTAEMLTLVGLDGLGERMPYELSGGQQQRVALARALAPGPDILLLDEPFSNLDAALRAQVRHEVREILRATGTTCLFVTHDQEEALSFADKVGVMIDGRMVQAATPEVLYNYPATREVASFVGEANYLDGEVDSAGVLCALGRLPLANPAARGPVSVMLRPEALQIAPIPAGSAGGEAVITARILWREFYGHDQRLGLALDGGETLVARVQMAQAGIVPGSLGPGVRVQVRIGGPVVVYPE